MATKVADKLVEIRRENGRKALERHGGGAKIARMMGLASASMLSQVFGPSPSRNQTEKIVRRMEQVLNLPHLSLDHEGGEVPPVGVDVVAAVIRLVGQTMESEGVSLSPSRFADVVSLAYTDTMEHGGVPREAHIRSVVRLLK